MRTSYAAVMAFSLVLISFPSSAPASRQEAEDLKRQIQSQRSAVSDLDRLDERHAVTAEITLLRTWLDEAMAQHDKGEFKRVREVVDRCLAEADLIRQEITTSKQQTIADDRAQALKQSGERLEQTKKALLDAQSTKKALEMNVK